MAFQPRGRMPRRRDSAAFSQPDSAALPDLWLGEPDHRYAPGVRQWFKQQVNRRLRRRATDEMRRQKYEED